MQSGRPIYYVFVYSNSRKGVREIPQTLEYGDNSPIHRDRF